MAGDHAALEQQFLNVAKTELKVKIPADGATDNGTRETMAMVERVRFLHRTILADPFVKVTMLHRAIKRRTRPMLGFKTFRCARLLLAGIELMHMIAKGRMKCVRGTPQSDADQFYELAI